MLKAHHSNIITNCYNDYMPFDIYSLVSMITAEVTIKGLRKGLLWATLSVLSVDMILKLSTEIGETLGKW